MMKIHLVLLGLFLAISGFLSAEEPSHEADEAAVLVIHISNGTRDGQVPEGMPVTVNFYHDDDLLKQTTGLTDAEGNCTINEIPQGSDIIAVAQVKYSNMAFSSTPLYLEAGKKRHELPIQIFEVTYDNSLIQAGTHHMIVKKNGINVRITEYIQLINGSDKAILAEQKDAEAAPKVIEIMLPKNFRDLSFSSYFHPNAVIQTETGFYDTMAIPPGSYHGVFSYDVPLREKAIDFTKSITLPTKSVMIFIEAGCGITSELGEPAGQMTLKDGTNTNYYTVDVSPGSVLTFHAEGITIPKPQQSIWRVLGTVFAMIVIIAAVRLMKQRPKA